VSRKSGQKTGSIKNTNNKNITAHRTHIKIGNVINSPFVAGGCMECAISP